MSGSSISCALWLPKLLHDNQENEIRIIISVSPFGTTVSANSMRCDKSQYCILKIAIRQCMSTMLKPYPALMLSQTSDPAAQGSEDQLPSPTQPMFLSHSFFFAIHFIHSITQNPIIMQFSSFVLALAGVATAWNCACGNGAQGKTFCANVGGKFDGSVSNFLFGKSNEKKRL